MVLELFRLLGNRLFVEFVIAEDNAGTDALKGRSHFRWQQMCSWHTHWRSKAFFESATPHSCWKDHNDETLQNVPRFATPSFKPEGCNIHDWRNVRYGVLRLRQFG